MIPGPEKDNTILLMVLGLVIIILIAAVVYMNTNGSDNVEPENNITDNVSAIVIQPELCPDCDGSKHLIEQLGGDEEHLGMRIADVRTVLDTSEEGKKLIKNYSINKLPAVLLKKEGNWSEDFLTLWKKDFGTKEKDNVIVYRNVMPPYLTTANNATAGFVDAVEIVPVYCNGCFNSSEFIISLSKYPSYVHFKEIIKFNETNPGAKALMEKYGITRLPAVLLSPDIYYYKISETFGSMGSKSKDGWFLLTKIPPPYYDVKTSSIKGRTTIIYITDSKCTDCRDIHAYADDVINVFDIYITDTKEYDISSAEAKNITSKYKINTIPAFLISGDVSAYNGFDAFWVANGNTKEVDNWYVFRSANSVGEAYK